MEEPLSLRPAVASHENTDSLSDWVNQVWRERGHLRNINEDVLQAEIDAEAEEEESSDDDMGESKKMDATERMKELFAAKAEMVELANEASNEAMTLLDFISLLASKDAPIQATATMSPALKEMTPAGTMGYDKTAASKLSESAEVRAEKEAIGLNFQSLHATADNLLSSATRLEQEMEKEARYWREVLSVSEQGWSLSRYRSESHTVGVRYGCFEAGPAFRGRGLAALRPGETGNLTLDLGSNNTPKSLRVRMAESGEVVESSSLAGLLEAETSPLEALVQQARDSLFDEELFHELTKEARNLLSSGVRITSDCILIPLEAPKQEKSRRLSLSLRKPKREILVDLVDLNEPSISESDTANAIVVYLRLGLSHAYKERYARRTQPPLPLSSEKAPAKTLSLIESSLCLFEHHAVVKDSRISLEHLVQTLESAGFESKLDTETVFTRTREALKRKGKAAADLPNPHSDARNALGNLFTSSDGPQRTGLTLSLPGVANITLNLATSLYAPHYGTNYSTTSSLPTLDSAQTEPDPADPTEALESVQALVRLALLKHLAEQCPGWTLDADSQGISARSSGKSRHLTVQMKKGKLVAVSRSHDASEKPVILGAWDRKVVKTTVEAAGLLDLVRVQVDT